MERKRGRGREGGKERQRDGKAERPKTHTLFPTHADFALLHVDLLVDQRALSLGEDLLGFLEEGAYDFFLLGCE